MIPYPRHLLFTSLMDFFDRSLSPKNSVPHFGQERRASKMSIVRWAPQ